MQLIFLSLPLAALIPLPPGNHVSEFLQRPDVRHILIFLGVVLVSSQITGILSLWGSSKVVVHKDASTLMNAVKVWFFNWLTAIAMVVGAAVILPSMAGSGERARVGLVIAGLGLLSLMLGLLIPMKVYVIGFLRTFLVLLLAGLFNSVAVAVLNIVLLHTTGLQEDLVKLQVSAGKTPDEQRAFGERLIGHDAPDEIDRMLDDALYPIGPQPPLPQHEAMVRTLQQKLGARQQAIQPGDKEAQATYQNQLNRYLQFRNEVLAERNGQAAVPAH